MSRLKSLSNLMRTIRRPIVYESSKQSLELSVPALYAPNRFCSSEVPSKTPEKNSSVPDSPRNPDLSDYGPLLLPSFNLAAYANQSPLLQEFIKLGVELYKLEKNPAVSEFLLTLDFEKNVKPYLLFLHDNGVAAEEFGQFITKNPFIFKEDLNDLEIRINYLQSKKFSPEMISKIITKNPRWLGIPVKNIDERLGYLQQTFHLKGDEVRELITKAPILVSVKKKILMVNTFTLKEEMDLDDKSLKKLVLAFPSLLKRNSMDLISTYDYLTRTMMVPQHLILKQPSVLATRKFEINERHRFLESLGRAQYNPLLPGYVSLLDLVSTNDEEFCEKISKTSVHLFNEFLKTL